MCFFSFLFVQFGSATKIIIPIFLFHSLKTFIEFHLNICFTRKENSHMHTVCRHTREEKEGNNCFSALVLQAQTATTTKKKTPVCFFILVRVYGIYLENCLCINKILIMQNSAYGHHYFFFNKCVFCLYFICLVAYHCFCCCCCCMFFFTSKQFLLLCMLSNSVNLLFLHTKKKSV